MANISNFNEDRSMKTVKEASFAFLIVIIIKNPFLTDVQLLVKDVNCIFELKQSQLFIYFFHLKENRLYN